MAELFGWNYISIAAPVLYSCNGFGGQDLLEVNEITDLKSGKLVWSDLTTFTPDSDEAVVRRSLLVPRSHVPEVVFEELFRSQVLLAFDIRIENRFREVLFQDRKLHQVNVGA